MKIAFACSVAAKTAFDYIGDKLNKIKSLEKELKPLLNQKHHISASNLDIKKQIKQIKQGQPCFFLI